MSSKLNLLAVIVLIVLFSKVAHYGFQYEPELPILPEVPSELSMQVKSLGDSQFNFRLTGVELQNSGDTFGRFTSLKDYNYETLRDWFLMLDNVDDKSSLMPSLASYYYVNTQNPADTRYLVEYLEARFDRDPDKNWWWLVEAISISQFKLRDNPTALRLAFKINSASKVKKPAWVRDMPAIIYAQMGENELAYKIIQDLLQNHDDYTQGELNYLSLFVRDRLKILDNAVKQKQPATREIDDAKRYHQEPASK